MELSWHPVTPYAEPAPVVGQGDQLKNYAARQILLYTAAQQVVSKLAFSNVRAAVESKLRAPVCSCYVRSVASTPQVPAAMGMRGADKPRGSLTLR